MAIYQENTTNTSFISLVDTLKSKGSVGFKKILKVINNDVKFIDPWNPDLTDYQKELVIKESRKNIWYFLREVVRINESHYQMTEHLFLLFDNSIKCRDTVAVTARQNGFGVAVILLSKWRQIRGEEIIDIYTMDDQERDYLLSKEIAIELPDYFNVGLYIPAVFNDNNIKRIRPMERPIVYSKTLSIINMQKIMMLQENNPKSQFLFISKRPNSDINSEVISEEFRDNYDRLLWGRTEIDVKNTHKSLKGRFFIE